MAQIKKIEVINLGIFLIVAQVHSKTIEVTPTSNHLHIKNSLIPKKEIRSGFNKTQIIEKQKEGIAL